MPLYLYLVHVRLYTCLYLAFLGPNPMPNPFQPLPPYPKSSTIGGGGFRAGQLKHTSNILLDHKAHNHNRIWSAPNFPYHQLGNTANLGDLKYAMNAIAKKISDLILKAEIWNPYNPIRRWNRRSTSSALLPQRRAFRSNSKFVSKDFVYGAKSKTPTIVPSLAVPDILTKSPMANAIKYVDMRGVTGKFEVQDMLLKRGVLKFVALKTLKIPNNWEIIKVCLLAGRVGFHHIGNRF